MASTQRSTHHIHGCVWVNVSLCVSLQVLPSHMWSAATMWSVHTTVKTATSPSSCPAGCSSTWPRPTGRDATSAPSAASGPTSWAASRDTAAAAMLGKVGGKGMRASWEKKEEERRMTMSVTRREKGKEGGQEGKQQRWSMRKKIRMITEIWSKMFLFIFSDEDQCFPHISFVL